LAVSASSTEISRHGVGSPLPIVERWILGRSLTVEQLLAGDIAGRTRRRDTSRPRSRVASVIEAGRNVEDKSGLEGPALLDGSDGALWPIPHSSRFDSKPRRTEPSGLTNSRGRLVDDWMGFLGTCHWLPRLASWQRGLVGDDDRYLRLGLIGLASETYLVAVRREHFHLTGPKPGGSLPNLEEMRGFIADYERARGRRF